MHLDKEQTSTGSHGILISTDGDLLFQQRDNNPNIVNPGLISLFGGTLMLDENAEKGLSRELIEELELDITNLTLEKLGTFFKTKAIDGIDYEIHVFIIRNIEFSKLKLKEGKSIVKISLEEALKNDKLTRITRVALESFKSTVIS